MWIWVDDPGTGDRPMDSHAHIKRRTLLAGAAAATAGMTLASIADAEPAAADPGTATPGPATPGPAKLRWRDGVPATTNGSAWGVPWARGTVSKQTTFALATADGTPVAVQSWPLAYWPDGSVKWSGHCVGADAGLAETLRL